MEKIWILYDIDDTGTIELDEVVEYLKEMAQPYLQLDEKQMLHIFDEIDLNENGKIEKAEMEEFLWNVLDGHMNLCLKLRGQEKVSAFKTLAN